MKLIKFELSLLIMLYKSQIMKRRKLINLYLVISLTLFSACFTFLRGQVNSQDSLALVSLYSSTNGEQWTNHSNWLEGPVSSWYGIVVQGDRVTKVDLFNNMLSGTIPDEIGDLTALAELNLAINQLSGPIPVAIGNLSELEKLVLSKNELSGTIPTEMGMLSILEVLTLFDNQLIGPLPDLSALQDLTELVLGANDFTGPFPEWVSNMPNLTFVGFRRVGLTGNLPSSLFEALPNLDHLRVDNNELEGDISVWFHGTTPMQTLDIYNNKFTGHMQNGVVDVNINSFSIARNLIEGIPDFSSATEMKGYFGVDQNKLGFHELEKAKDVSTFNPSNLLLGPQGNLLKEETLVVKEGESLTISSGSTGSSDTYQWFKNGAEIPGGNSSEHQIPSYSLDDAGEYYCIISNSLFNFDLQRSTVVLQTDDATSVKEQFYTKVKIYPNPASGYIKISTEGFKSSTIIALNGHPVQTSDHPDIDISSLFPGVYLIRVERLDGIAMKTLVKVD